MKFILRTIKANENGIVSALVWIWMQNSMADIKRREKSKTDSSKRSALKAMIRMSKSLEADDLGEIFYNWIEYMNADYDLIAKREKAMKLVGKSLKGVIRREYSAAIQAWLEEMDMSQIKENEENANENATFLLQQAANAKKGSAMKMCANVMKRLGSDGVRTKLAAWKRASAQSKQRKMTSQGYGLEAKAKLMTVELEASKSENAKLQDKIQALYDDLEASTRQVGALEHKASGAEDRSGDAGSEDADIRIVKLQTKLDYVHEELVQAMVAAAQINRMEFERDQATHRPLMPAAYTLRVRPLVPAAYTPHVHSPSASVCSSYTLHRPCTYPNSDAS